MRKPCLTTALWSWRDRRTDGLAGAKSSCPNWPRTWACRCRYVVGSRVADAFRARGMKFPPKGGCGVSLPRLRVSPERAFFGHFPASLLRFGANLPRLKVLPVDLPVPPWPVGIMTLKNWTLTPVVQLFIDCAREVVKPLAT